jgi:hypothetical protein
MGHHPVKAKLLKKLRSVDFNLGWTEAHQQLSSLLIFVLNADEASLLGFVTK